MKKNFFYFYLILTLLQASSDKLIDSLLEAETYMLLEEYSFAEEEYIKALNFSSNNVSILISLYEVNLLQGKIKSAENFIAKAFRLDEENIEIIKKYYDLLILQNKNIHAKNIIDKALTINSNDIKLYYEKIKLLFELNEWVELLDVYNIIYNLTNDHNIIDQMQELSVATNNVNQFIEIMIGIYQDSQRLDHLNRLINVTYNYAPKLCEEYILLALENDPNNFDLNILLAQYYINSKEFLKSITILETIESRFDSIELHKLMLLVYRRLNNSEQQIKMSEKIIQLYPNEKLGYDSLALLYITNNNFKDAYSIVIEIKSRFPENNNSNYYFGLLSEMKNDFAKAREYFEIALSNNPNSKEILFSLALNVENSNEYACSDSLFNLFLGSNPTPTDKNDYAYVISQRKSIDREKLLNLLDLALEALESRPKSPEFLDTVGYIYYKIGNINRAIYYYELSLKYDNNNITILSHLLDAYYKVNNFIRAKEVESRIRYLDPKFKFYRNLN